jgi:uncharacterized tellurite resistance protein B-like protein
MDDQSREIVKALVEMAWADGEVSPEESALLVKCLQEAGADPDDVNELSRLLAQPGNETTVEQAHLDPSQLDHDKRLGVMRALLIMSFMDGHVSFAEYAQIERVQNKLAISDDEMEALRTEAVAAAETLSAS